MFMAVTSSPIRHLVDCRPQVPNRVDSCRTVFPKSTQVPSASHPKRNLSASAFRLRKSPKSPAGSRRSSGVAGQQPGDLLVCSQLEQLVQQGAGVARLAEIPTLPLARPPPVPPVPSCRQQRSGQAVSALIRDCWNAANPISEGRQAEWRNVRSGRVSQGSNSAVSTVNIRGG
jgi:hypothetical protein